MSKKHEKKQDKEYKPAAEAEHTVHVSVNCEGDKTADKQQNEEPAAVDSRQNVQQKRTDNCCAQVEVNVAKSTKSEAEEQTTEKLAVLEAKCKNLQDQYLRKAADFDNYRKRMIREKQEAIDYANTNLISDLLQILDDFDRAIEAGKKVEEESTSAFMQGMVMIRTSLFSLLESKYALRYYEAVGKAFDPEVHEAVATSPSAEVTEPTVGAELQKGYKLKERVIRHAKVMVLMPEQKEKT